MFPCPECGLRPRYLLNGKWSTLDKIMKLRLPPDSLSLRPQHSRWCLSEEAFWNRIYRGLT